ncbi:MAG: hypothetical protein M0R17_08400 [Candidatus Omnitrophica bacterium]|nr:hypothetical protein [Candidatus Omnitrophota bacterium]
MSTIINGKSHYYNSLCCMSKITTDNVCSKCSRKTIASQYIGDPAIYPGINDEGWGKEKLIQFMIDYNNGIEYDVAIMNKNK